MLKNSLITAFLFIALSGYSQQICTRMITDFGTSSGDYLIQGSATLIDSSGVLYLTLSNDFSTNSGPDLYLYLSVKDEAPTASGNTHVEIAPLKSNSGASSYTIPGNHTIDEFNYLLVHCKQYNHFWDGGNFGTKNCNLSTGVGSRDLKSDLSIFPNPATGFVSVISNKEIKNLAIYNQLGEVVFEGKQPQIDVQTIPHGIYSIRVEFASGEIQIRKLIKE